MNSAHIRNLGAANHRAWCHKEAIRVTRGAIEVRELSVREALQQLNGVALALARYVFLRRQS